DRQARAFNARPSEHRARAEREGGGPQSHRAANRYRLRSGQSLPRHAGRLRRVRNEPAPGASARSHPTGTNEEHLQRPQAIHRRGEVKAMRDSGMGPAAIAKELKMARSSVYRVLAA